MTNQEIVAALLKYDKVLGHMHPAKWPSNAFMPERDQEGTRARVLQHVKWMIAEGLKTASESEALISNGRSDISMHRHLSMKAMRWLCFIQGVLWMSGWVTIDELRNDNSGLTPAETPTREL